MHNITCKFKYSIFLNDMLVEEPQICNAYFKAGIHVDRRSVKTKFDAKHPFRKVMAQNVNSS